MNRLKELRALTNYSLRDLHKLTGIANSTISEIETGKRKMNVNHAKKLSKVFGYAPYYIMGTDAIKYDETRVDGYEDIISSILNEILDGAVIEHNDEIRRKLLACDMILGEWISNENMDQVLSLLQKLMEKGKESCE